MMGRLRAMREPLKYVQGRDATLKFHEEMGYMGKRWLFVCSNSGYKACHDKIEKSFGELDDYRRYEVFGGISSKGEIAKMEEIGSLKEPEHYETWLHSIAFNKCRMYFRQKGREDNISLDDGNLSEDIMLTILLCSLRIMPIARSLNAV